MLPSYLPSNMTSGEVRALVEREFPWHVSERILEVPDYERELIDSAAWESGHNVGFEEGRRAQDEDAYAALQRAADLLESIPEDNGADAFTDRAIAEAIKVLRAAL